MRPLFPRGSGADNIRHAAKPGEDAPEGKSSTNRFSRHGGVGGILSDLAAHVRPSVMTYERRLNNIPVEGYGKDKLTRFAVRLDTLPRSWRWGAFNEVLKKVVGDTRSSTYGPVPLSGRPMPSRAKPLTELASRIGNLPEPATRVSAFDGVLKAYGDLTEFASNSTGTTRKRMELELPELRKALESAISHLPEHARPEALASLNEIG